MVCLTMDVSYPDGKPRKDVMWQVLVLELWQETQVVSHDHGCVFGGGLAKKDPAQCQVSQMIVTDQDFDKFRCLLHKRIDQFQHHAGIVVTDVNWHSACWERKLNPGTRVPNQELNPELAMDESQMGESLQKKKAHLGKHQLMQT